MTIDTSQTVADLAQSLSGAAKTFEQLGIDYCCRGKQPLVDAVREANLALADVRAVLEQNAAENEQRPVPRDLRALISHIVDKHHVFTREELARLLPLAEKVTRVHSARHPELSRVQQLVTALEADLLLHMLKEERVLFPYVLQLVDGERTQPVFGTVANPIFMMSSEHEHVGALLAELEQQTDHYTPPADACGSYRVLYTGLKALQADIHQHVYLENHLLFPTALELEQTA